MKEIELPNGMITVVDDDVYKQIQDKKITCSTSLYNFYVYVNGKHLHNFVMTAPKGYQVDHIDQNPLNNLRSNLRVVTRQQNQWNKAPYNGKPYKGVTQLRRSRLKQWAHLATIKVNGKPYRVGIFDELSEAIRAYDAKAIEVQGEFAYLNFPEGYEQVLPDHLIERFRAEKLSKFKRPKDY